jgi:hypothetical protein
LRRQTRRRASPVALRNGPVLLLLLPPVVLDLNAAQGWSGLLVRYA